MIYIVITVLFSFLIPIYTFLRTAYYFCIILGKDKCIDIRGLNRGDCCFCSIFASIISAIAFWKHYGYWGLITLLFTPLVLAFIAALMLRFGAREYRRREFAINETGIRNRRTGLQLQPTYLKCDESFAQTGPVSGYNLYRIQLYDNHTLLAENRYVNACTYQHDYTILVWSLGCSTMDVAFAIELDNQEIASVRFGEHWNDILFSDQNLLTEPTRQYWRQFSSPQLGREHVIELNPGQLLAQAEALAASLKSIAGDAVLEIRQSALFKNNSFLPRVGSDISSLMRLCNHNKTVFVMPIQHLDAFRIARWGGEYATICRFADGLWIVRPKRPN